MSTPGGDSAGYSVQTKALINTAGTYQAAADEWHKLVQTFQSWYLSESDLGIVGDQANVIHDYNVALQSIVGNTITGGSNLTEAAQELHNSALSYENQEQQSIQRLAQAGEH